MLISLTLLLFSVDPKDPSIEYKWFDVGVLDYDPGIKQYYVQKVNSKGRIVDGRNKPIVNGGLKNDGEIYTSEVCIQMKKIVL